MLSSEYTYKQFNNFIKKYDMNNKMIKLKIAHMIRVMNINKQFAIFQNLDKENIELATIIGLLHDIGRFVQIEKYNTFIDSQSVNHSIAGVELLFKDGYIEYFVEDSKYYYTIEKAISNHNKIEIEDGLDEITLLHSKLIRDADKTDIYEVTLIENLSTVFVGKYNPNAKINSKALEDFYSHRMVNNVNLQTNLDDYIRILAFIYNYYFIEDLKYVKDKNYITRMHERFLDCFKFNNTETVKELKKASEYANSYINKKEEIPSLISRVK